MSRINSLKIFLLGTSAILISCEAHQTPHDQQTKSSINNNDSHKNECKNIPKAFSKDTTNEQLWLDYEYHTLCSYSSSERFAILDELIERNDSKAMYARAVIDSIENGSDPGSSALMLKSAALGYDPAKKEIAQYRNSATE